MSDAQQYTRWRHDVTAEDMLPWVEALRDDNPIHRDPAVAEALGFGPHTINPGPLNLAYALNALAALGEGRTPRRIEARFLANVTSADGVAVTAAPVDGGWTATVTTDAGAIAVEATILFDTQP